MANPPDYLMGRARAPETDGPAALLMDGRWCGHGQPAKGYARWTATIKPVLQADLA